MKHPFHKILVVDSGGTPKGWVSYRDAIVYAAKDAIAWVPPSALKHQVFGGTNRDGNVSSLEIASIMAIRGPAAAKFLSKSKAPSVSRKVLFARDHYRCAYCGQVFTEASLTKDHIVPKRMGGKNSWTNLITACKPCNSHKADRSLTRSGMTLLFEPYVPTMLEVLYFSNPKMGPEQQEYVENFVHAKKRYKPVGIAA